MQEVIFTAVFDEHDLSRFAREIISRAVSAQYRPGNLVGLPCVTLNRAGFKEGGQGPTKLFIHVFYFSLMMDAYESTT